jgi:2-polyprenyl-3-methyl-5-hydroxy-6-metoxy-1,4-benzoquinol methylase
MRQQRICGGQSNDDRLDAQLGHKRQVAVHVEALPIAHLFQRRPVVHRHEHRLHARSKMEISVEARRAQLNAEVEALLAAGGAEERVAALVEEMGRLLGASSDDSSAALRPVVWRGLSFGQRWAGDAAALGNSVWRGAIELADFLASQPERVRGKQVVELGCGAGLTGCAAASLGAASVLLTDTEAVLSLARENVSRNGLSEIVSCRALLWGETQQPAPPADVVLGAELIARLYVCIFVVLFSLLTCIRYDGGALLATLEWLGAPALLSYQRHDPVSPAAFLAAAKERGFEVEVLQSGEVEIVLLSK